jgi:uncharacterized protein YeaO (DUF488 family)
MIKQCTVEDLKNNRVTKQHGQIILITRYYPRFLKKNLFHEYQPCLAPTRELLKEFKNCEKTLFEADPRSLDAAHNLAFEQMNYESKFTLSEEGLAEIDRLSQLSRSSQNGGQVFLACHCPVGIRCHRELLMIIGEALFGAKIARLHFPWTTFRDRLKNGDARQITHFSS